MERGGPSPVFPFLSFPSFRLLRSVLYSRFFFFLNPSFALVFQKPTAYSAIIHRLPALPTGLTT